MKPKSKQSYLANTIIDNYPVQEMVFSCHLSIMKA